MDYFGVYYRQQSTRNIFEEHRVKINKSNQMCRNDDSYIMSTFHY